MPMLDFNRLHATMKCILAKEKLFVIKENVILLIVLNLRTPSQK